MVRFAADRSMCERRATGGAMPQGPGRRVRPGRAGLAATGNLSALREHAAAMADHRADQLTGDATGGPVTLTFAELEFVLRCAGDRDADVVRRRLDFQPGVSTGIAVAAGVASLVTRDLCRPRGRPGRAGRVRPVRDRGAGAGPARAAGRCLMVVRPRWSRAAGGVSDGGPRAVCRRGGGLMAVED
ncbi:hypothetical protein [Dactylosporangium sp. NPDC051484]|uniref:hypothetical protein n=1 Tax=Dactylosporangium sp. NPDC051484 TaxID=3154942 RepID=UPI00344F5A22